MQNHQYTDIIISDLHVGAGPLDDCDSQLDDCLVRFIENYAAQTSAIELVINGDFLDFAQAAPWRDRLFEADSDSGIPLCFSEEQSVEKLTEILRCHPHVFDALASFLADPGHRLVILPGNHDVDFFWQTIQDQLVTRLCGSTTSPRAQQIEYCLEPVYVPAHLPHVRIEHGHRYDPCNRFVINGTPWWSQKQKRRPIFRDTTGKERLLECIGTRFMIQLMNDLDYHYPFIDNIKPFSKVFNLYLLSLLHPHRGPIKGFLAAQALTRFLVDKLQHNPSNLLSSYSARTPKEEVEERIAKALQGRIAELSDAKQRELTQRLEAQGFSLGKPVNMFVSSTKPALRVADFLGSHPEVCSVFGEETTGYLGTDSSTPGMLSLAQGYLQVDDETKQLMRGGRINANGRRRLPGCYGSYP